MIEAKKLQISEAGRFDVGDTDFGPHEYLHIDPIAIAKEGYIYIYLSNETPGSEVYFDDLLITHTQGRVIQKDDYYPFGLTFNTSEREGSLSNKYLYNQGVGEKTFKTERDLELKVDMSKFRTYDYVLGIWWQVDPASDQSGQESWSPYHYSFNNPIRLNDPNGDCPPGVDCNNPLPTMQVRRNRASNLGPGNVRNNGTRFHAGHDLHAPTGTNVSSTLAGTVVSSYNSASYGNTVVVKSNIHPEAQPGFIGPPRPGGPPENNIYVQYSHLNNRNVAVGDNVTVGQTVGTVGNTGNASNLSGEDIHLHIQAGTALNSANTSISNASTIDPNQVYEDVNFSSADPNANQTNTGIIKTVTDENGQQTRIYQPVNTTGQDAILLDEVEFVGN